MSATETKYTPIRVQLSKFDNRTFDHGANKAFIFLWIIVDILFVRNPINVFIGFKVWILKLFGATIGKRPVIKPGVHIKYPWKLILGDDVWIGEKAWIDNLVEVRIGNNVCISQDAYLLTGNHDYRSETFALITGPIVLEEGVWIGAKTVVCPGVTCKAYSVLTVGSIATNDLEANSIYQGNPAIFKTIRWKY
jgi:putative colanic acid biosynthesis acetyltransferase WcaF